MDGMRMAMASRPTTGGRGRGFGRTRDPSGRNSKEENQGKDGENVGPGRVDFVDVENWGKSANWQNEDALGKLHVKRHERMRASAQDTELDLHVRLAAHLQACERGGWLDTAGMDAELPPFERWSFEENRYVSYLCRAWAVHQAIERMEQDMVGWKRSNAIETDLQAIRDTANQVHDPDVQVVDAQTRAYVQYIDALVKKSDAGREGREEARARWFAHWYVVHMTHWTSGTRIGARADHKLDLKRRNAMHFYRMGDKQGKEVLQKLLQHVNEAGKNMEEKEIEAVLQELPKAMQRCSLLLTALAVEDERS